MGRNIKIILALFLMLFVSCFFVDKVMALDTGDTVSFTTYKYSDDDSVKFTVPGGYSGTCRQMGNPYSRDGGTATVTKVSNTNDYAVQCQVVLVKPKTNDK